MSIPSSPFPRFGAADTPVADALRARRPRSITRTGDRRVAAPLGGMHFALARGEICSVVKVRDFALHCADGTLWITWPEYGGDAIVSRGEGLVIPSGSSVVVMAMCPSSLAVPPGFALEVAERAGGRCLWLRRVP